MPQPRQAVPCSRKGCGNTTKDPSGKCFQHKGAPERPLSRPSTAGHVPGVAISSEEAERRHGDRVTSLRGRGVDTSEYEGDRADLSRFEDAIGHVDVPTERQVRVAHLIVDSGVEFEVDDTHGYWIEDDYYTEADAERSLLAYMTADFPAEPYSGAPAPVAPVNVRSYPPQEIEKGYDAPFDSGSWTYLDTWCEGSVASSGSYGDYAVGVSYSSRSARKDQDGSYTVRESGFYVEPVGDGVIVRERTQVTRCADFEDPGDTETGTDIEYREHGVYEGLREATERCKELALAAR